MPGILLPSLVPEKAQSAACSGTCLTPFALYRAPCVPFNLQLGSLCPARLARLARASSYTGSRDGLVTTFCNPQGSSAAIRINTASALSPDDVHMATQPAQRVLWSPNTTALQVLSTSVRDLSQPCSAQAPGICSYGILLFHMLQENWT